MVQVGAKIMVDQHQEVRRMLSATTVVKEGTSRMSVGYSRRMEIVITVFRHDLEDHKHKNGVATDLFCTGVIGHPGS